ncbi:senescence-associated protein-domain-containing protein [Dissophora ornata]|nr:senescence-associated protein-domain-containing protein [Dissophora ornata]
MSTSSSPPDDAPSVVQVILAIPKATINQLTSATTKKKKPIGHGELRIYSSALPGAIPVADGQDGSNAPPTTFMTLETNETPSKSYKSLITHPLMPRSTAQKTGDRSWRFSVAGDGFLELELPEASESDITALENLLTDRIIYTNQHQLRNQLALVDDVGQIFGVLDSEGVEVDDDDNVSLSENQKSPVIIEAIEPRDEQEDKPLKLKVSVPSTDDMANYLTSASQYFGESMIKGATAVAGGITSSSTNLNSKIPESRKPLKISPFIKNRIRNITKVSRATFSVTSRLKTAIVTKALDSGYRAIKYWTSKDDPQSYSTMQNVCYSILNSAGILIQATEESIGIVSAPAISATQELAGRALGPDAKELVTEALEGLKNFTLVYFDGAGISRRAFLHTSRLAALHTAQEIKEGKIKMKERTKNQEDRTQESVHLTEQAGAAAHRIKELVFSYFGKTDEQNSDAGEGSSSDATTAAVLADKKKTE